MKKEKSKTTLLAVVKEEAAGSHKVASAMKHALHAHLKYV